MTLFQEDDGLDRRPVSATDHATVMGPDDRTNPRFAAAQWVGCWLTRHEHPGLMRVVTDPDRLDYWGDFEWCALLLEGWVPTSVLIRSDNPQHVSVALLREVGMGSQRVDGPSVVSEMRLLTLSRRPDDGAWLAWSLEPWSGHVDEQLEVISTEYLA